MVDDRTKLIAAAGGAGILLLLASRGGSADGGNGNGDNGGNGGNGDDGNGGGGWNDNIGLSLHDTGQAWVYDGGRSPRVGISVHAEDSLESKRGNVNLARSMAFHLGGMAEISNRSCRVAYGNQAISVPGDYHPTGSEALSAWQGYLQTDAPGGRIEKDSNILVLDHGRTGRAYLGGNAAVAGAALYHDVDEPYIFREYREGWDGNSMRPWAGFGPTAHELFHNLGMTHTEHGCIWDDHEELGGPAVTPMCNIDAGPTNLCGGDSDIGDYRTKWLRMSECMQQHWDLEPEGTAVTIHDGTGIVVE